MKNTFITKIMKKEDDEPKKLSKLVKKINSIKSPHVKQLIDKYITKIHDSFKNRTSSNYF